MSVLVRCHGHQNLRGLRRRGRHAGQDRNAVVGLARRTVLRLGGHRAGSRSHGGGGGLRLSLGLRLGLRLSFRGGGGGSLSRCGP